ncbi:MAG: GGDEF domain-containing protein [Oscillospiraceae bacterium]|nr:GGDEF domain-containing protein [Oscillospiraceae bacterium]
MNEGIPENDERIRSCSGDLFGKMNLNGNTELMSSERAANRFNMRIQFITLGAMMVIAFLNVLNIFIIDDTLMYISLGLCTACTLITAVLFSFCDQGAAWVKYLLLTALTLMISAVGVTLTYHAVLISLLPIICSAQYKSKRVIYFTFAMSVAGSLVSVMAGYFFGLCDANMLLLTTGPAAEYYDSVTMTPNFTEINTDPWGTIPVYFVLPRVIVMLIFVVLIVRISNVISSNAVKEAALKKLSETDTMTQMYNKNKYVQMLSEYYPNVKRVGVIFWDINGLKSINDTMGHDYGDYLISTIAASVMKFADDSAMVYRIGGDEFVMIAENPSEEDITELIEQWHTDIAVKNIGSKIQLSAAVGYAIGSGSVIEDVIKDADSNMYEDKQSIKENA